MNSLSGLSVILRIFNFFGFTTFSLAVKTSENPNDVPYEKLLKVRMAPLIHNLGFILLIAGTNGMILNQVCRKEESLYNLTDLIDVTFGSLVAVFILVYHFAQQRVTLRLICTMFKLYAAADRMNSGSKGKSTFYFITLLFGFQLAINAIVLVTTFVYYHKLIDLLSTVCRHLIIMWLVAQYSLVMRVLLDVFRNLNASLASLTRTTSAQIQTEKQQSGSFLFSTKELQSFLKIRSLHKSLVDVCQEVDSFYEITIFAGTMYIFVYLIATSYFILDLAVEKEMIFEVIEYTHMVLSQISFLVPLLALVRLVVITENESNNTGQIIHQLLRGTLNNEITKELNEFSLYLLHARVKFTAWGIFLVDGSLIKAIFGSITTYLVILLQFQLQTTTKKALNDTQCRS